MKRNYGLVVLPLLFSLFVYLFYRTEKTLITEIFISLISLEKYHAYRSFISAVLPLNEHVIYSLPEGLWVFSITLTSKNLFFKVGEREISLLFFPLVFSIGLELFQLLHLTNGKFDFWDIGLSVLFWGFAHYLVPHKSARQNILNPFTMRSFICLVTYAIVYLAHVWK